MHFSGVDVVIPAHDEQDLLGACLDALEACVAATPVPVSVTVVLDSCTDRSAEIARGRARIVRTDARNVGVARAMGFDTLPSPPGARWYATTDADSRVPRTWLADQLALAHGSADVVAGLIEVDDWSGWGPATRARYLEGYHPGDGHRHIHGANLGISARAYRLLGGFDPLPVHEDARLVRRAEAAGLTVEWSPAAPVITSARRHSRTPGGFAAHLVSLGRGSVDPADTMGVVAP